jgi:hypothetical protein
MEIIILPENDDPKATVEITLSAFAIPYSTAPWMFPYLQVLYFPEESLGGVFCQDSRMIRTGQPDTGKKDKVGKAVCGGAADEHDQGFTDVDCEQAQGRHSRPPDEVAEADEEEPGDHTDRRFDPEPPKIDLFRQGRSDIGCFGQVFGNFSDHRGRRLSLNMIRLATDADVLKNEVLLLPGPDNQALIDERVEF